MNVFVSLTDEAARATEMTSHKIMLDGRCSINGGDDEACTTVALSLTRLMLLSNATVSFADDAVLSLPPIGLLKAVVSRTFTGGFDLKFDLTARSKLARYVHVLETRQRGGTIGRDHQRFVPIKTLVTLRRPGEPDSMARIIDLSRSGVTFTSSKSFIVGRDLTVGLYPSKIVRVHESGASAHFNRVITGPNFDAMFDLCAPRAAYRSADEMPIGVGISNVP